MYETKEMKAVADSTLSVAFLWRVLFWRNVDDVCGAPPDEITKSKRNARRRTISYNL